MSEEEKRGRGLPVERPIEPIPAPVGEIRDAIFRATKCKPADSIEETAGLRLITYITRY